MLHSTFARLRHRSLDNTLHSTLHSTFARLRHRSLDSTLHSTLHSTFARLRHRSLDSTLHSTLGSKVRHRRPHLREVRTPIACQLSGEQKRCCFQFKHWFANGYKSLHKMMLLSNTKFWQQQVSPLAVYDMYFFIFKMPTNSKHVNILCTASLGL